MENIPNYIKPDKTPIPLPVLTKVKPRSRIRYYAMSLIGVGCILLYVLIWTRIRGQIYAGCNELGCTLPAKCNPATNKCEGRALAKKPVDMIATVPDEQTPDYYRAP